MVATGSELRGLYLDTDNGTGQPFPTLRGLEGAVGVDYSASRNVIFFSEVAKKYILIINICFISLYFLGECKKNKSSAVG